MVFHANDWRPAGDITGGTPVRRGSLEGWATQPAALLNGLPGTSGFDAFVTEMARVLIGGDHPRRRSP